MPTWPTQLNGAGVLFNPTGNLLVTTQDTLMADKSWCVGVWEASSGALRLELRHRRDAVMAVAFADDEHLAASNWVHDTNLPKPRPPRSSSTWAARAMAHARPTYPTYAEEAYSPLGTPHHVHVWEVGEGEWRGAALMSDLEFEEGPTPISASGRGCFVGWSPDHQTIITYDAQLSALAYWTAPFDRPGRTVAVRPATHFALFWDGPRVRVAGWNDPSAEIWLAEDALSWSASWITSRAASVIESAW